MPSLTLLGVAIIAASCQAVRTAPQAGPSADVATLASRAFMGRRTGTVGGDSAAAFIVRRFTELGLRLAFRPSCDSELRCGASYVQVFPFRSTVGQNIVAIIDGADPTLRLEYLVIGAHFDGQSLDHVADPQHGFVLRPGADDNASGTAGLIELARRLEERPTRRSIIVVGFDAEEEGLCGSQAFVARAPVVRDAMKLMLNFEMIGHLQHDRVFVEGASELADVRVAFESAGGAVRLRPTFIADRGLSDHATFLDIGIEAVSLTTGDDPVYHTTADVAERINAAGLIRVVDLAEAFIRSWDAGSQASHDGFTRGLDASRRAGNRCI